jgi:hypothetical protein
MPLFKPPHMVELEAFAKPPLPGAEVVEFPDEPLMVEDPGGTPLLQSLPDYVPPLEPVFPR